MAYADYSFYTTKYFGNVVPETDFPRLAERASDRIDSLTNDRLSDTSWLTEKQLAKVQKACCVLTESLYYSEKLTCSGMEQVGTVDGKGKVISSVTSGSESVSYATGGASSGSVEGIAITKTADVDLVVRKVASTYLSGIYYKNEGYYILNRAYGKR